MRSSPWAALLATSLSGSIILSAAMCMDATHTASPPRSPRGDQATPADAVSGWACSTAPALTYRVPHLLAETTQIGADCYAWQLFISLNWPASSTRGQPDVDAGPADFGAPNSDAAVVWETYKGRSEIFLDGGAPPPPWDAAPPPADCSTGTPDARAGRRALATPSSASAAMIEFSPGDSVQAGLADAGGRNWLADQSGGIIWYEVAINQAEFDYIVDGGLYSAASQHDRVDAGEGIDPPAGSTEIKAAWRPLPAGAPTNRYLVTSACIPGPGGEPVPATLGLVGLHIVHKASNQPQWLWATFEQVDNVPEAGDAGDGGTFFSPSCDAATQPMISPACLPPDAGVVRQACTPNELPAYDLTAYFTDGGCPPYPVQVARMTPIPNSQENPVQATNDAAQALIAQGAPGSVFQYYQLVNVMWWDNSRDPNRRPRTAPLSTAGSEPHGPVANVVLEAFAQKDNCLTCHAYATIANAADGGPSTWSSNFSFIYGHAQWPQAAEPAPATRPVKKR